MICIDDRIIKGENGIFKKLIGKNFVYMSHDNFIPKAAYGVIGINIEGIFYKITNLTEVRDYFGSKEDVAVFKLKKDAAENIRAYLVDCKMVDFPINKKIINIDVINEHQCRLLTK